MSQVNQGCVKMYLQSLRIIRSAYARHFACWDCYITLIQLSFPTVAANCSLCLGHPAFSFLVAVQQYFVPFSKLKRQMSFWLASQSVSLGSTNCFYNFFSFTSPKPLFPIKSNKTGFDKQPLGELTLLFCLGKWGTVWRKLEVWQEVVCQSRQEGEANKAKMLGLLKNAGSLTSLATRTCILRGGTNLNTRVINEGLFTSKSIMSELWGKMSLLFLLIAHVC